MGVQTDYIYFNCLGDFGLAPPSPNYLPLELSVSSQVGTTVSLDGVNNTIIFGETPGPLLQWILSIGVKPQGQDTGVIAICTAINPDGTADTYGTGDQGTSNPSTPAAATADCSGNRFCQTIITDVTAAYPTQPLLIGATMGPFAAGPISACADPPNQPAGFASVTYETISPVQTEFSYYRTGTLNWKRSMLYGVNTPWTGLNQGTGAGVTYFAPGPLFIPRGVYVPGQGGTVIATWEPPGLPRWMGTRKRRGVPNVAGPQI